MNSDNLKTWATRSLATGAGILAVNMVGIPQIIGKNLPKNRISAYVSEGSSYALANEAVDLGFHGRSRLTTGNYISFLDNIAFLSAVSAVSNETQAVDKVFYSLSSVSPLNSDMNVALSQAGIVSGAVIVADALDIGTGNNKVFDFTRRPVSTLMASYQ